MEPQTILLVGDLSDKLTLSSRMLEGLGFQTKIIDDYKIALKDIKRNNYDYVMVELQMSEIDGDDLVDQARRCTSKSDTKYMLLTDGDFYKYFRDKGKNYVDCADICIARPFTPDGIRTLLSELSKVDQLAIE
jgi:CheY-like chemotaxis protein